VRRRWILTSHLQYIFTDLSVVKGAYQGGKLRFVCSGIFDIAVFVTHNCSRPVGFSVFNQPKNTCGMTGVTYTIHL